VSTVRGFGDAVGNAADGIVDWFARRARETGPDQPG
jgi:hypothetical protein